MTGQRTGPDTRPQSILLPGVARPIVSEPVPGEGEIVTHVGGGDEAGGDGDDGHTWATLAVPGLGGHQGAEESGQGQIPRVQERQSTQQESEHSEQGGLRRPQAPVPTPRNLPVAQRAEDDEADDDSRDLGVELGCVEQHR
jgi:hypothetical protein